MLSLLAFFFCLLASVHQFEHYCYLTCSLAASTAFKAATLQISSTLGTPLTRRRALRMTDQVGELDFFVYCNFTRWSAFNRSKIYDLLGYVFVSFFKYFFVCFFVDFFQKDQLFIILEFEFGGVDLENSNGTVSTPHHSDGSSIPPLCAMPCSVVMSSIHQSCQWLLKTSNSAHSVALEL